MAEHFDPDREKIDTLELFRRNGHSVVITMNDDPDLQACITYWADVGNITREKPAPTVELKISKLVIAHLSEKHLEAAHLFDVLRSGREAVDPTTNTATTLLLDLELLDRIEAEIGLVHEEQTIEFPEGLAQEVALSGMRFIVGIPH